MKKALIFSLTALFSLSAFADLQSPPMVDQGPTRKLSRGIANMAFGLSELPNSIALINEREGNAAALSYGVTKGVLRTLVRFGAGFYELSTFACPTYRGSYRPILPSNIPWIHSGYEEFPPELGWDSRLNYVTEGTAY